MPNHRNYLIRLWGVRLIAALAVVGIIATTILDFTTSFWVDHPMLGAYVSGLLLIALGTALVNEWLAARARRRWQEVAALALIQLRDRLTGIREALSNAAPAAATAAARDSVPTYAMAIIGDPAERARLADRIDVQLDEANQVAVTWAPVVVGDGTYVFALNSYVHLVHRAWRVGWMLRRDGGADHTADGPLAEEMAALALDAQQLRGRLDGMIGDLLPWPASFGLRPGAATG